MFRCEYKRIKIKEREKMTNTQHWMNLKIDEANAFVPKRRANVMNHFNTDDRSEFYTNGKVTDFGIETFDQTEQGELQ